MSMILRKCLTFLLAMLAILILASLPVFLAWPNEEPEATPSPEEIARGDYLVNRVAYCFNCHAERDWTRIGAPVIDATREKGAAVTLFGGREVFAVAITPAALTARSDAELTRALIAGIDRDGQPLHSSKPHAAYAVLKAEDARAIIAYLRHPTASEPGQAQTEASRPASTESRALGRYLVTLADCAACHGEDFSGGRTLYFPDGRTIESANITPVPGNRISAWSREDFIGVIQSLAAPELAELVVDDPAMRSPMPWRQYAGMDADDLGAIHDYLSSLEPVIREEGKKTHR